MASKIRRRSQSVSAVSRKESIISTQFSNSRDNPLFWDAADGDVTAESSEISRPSGSFVKKSSTNGRSNSSGGDELMRGRSVARSLSGKNGIGRSLSTARGRSVSRPHRYSSDESEKDRNMITSRRPWSSTNGTKPMRNGLVRTTSVGNKPVDTRNRLKNGRVSIHRNEVSELSEEDDSTCSLKAPHVDDGISSSSLSEAEAKTIQEFYNNIILASELSGEDDMPLSEIYETAQPEVKYAVPEDDHITAFRRNYVKTTENLVDMPSDVVVLGAGEFISAGIQREYAIKLEEAEERARELRADLAIEEHRAQELNRMLEEIPPEAPSVRKHRRGRRASNDRRNMSELLTEEAMAYFDECVSLSTFDSSDFSASEDVPRSSLSTSSRYDQLNNFHRKQVLEIHGTEDSVISVNSSSSNTKSTTDTQPQQFTFETPSADIHSYIKHFEKDVRKDSIVSNYKRSSYYDAEEYISNGRADRVLVDRVLYRRNIESGGFLLCLGPFSSFM